MDDREWELDDDEFMLDPELLEEPDEEGEEEERRVRPLRNLAQMERDGEAASAAIDRLLDADPDTPTDVLLEELRKHVRPMLEYRPTEAELFALRQADILYQMRKGNDPEGEDSGELSSDSSV